MPTQPALPADIPATARPVDIYRRGWRDGLRSRAVKGARARAKNLTPERRSEIARNAVKSRWERLDKAKAEAQIRGD
jgi:hypothetical protein